MEIGLFLEDIGHERFITSLICEVIERALPQVEPRFTMRNASGGTPRMQSELRAYEKDYLHSGYANYHLVVVAQDTDCKGVPATRQQILKIVGDYSSPLIVATPDPCIEAWYLADQSAVRTVAEASTTLPLPSGCDCDALKLQLLQLFREGGIDPPFGGAEYAGEIVKEMDLAKAAQNVASLGAFISEIRAAIADA